MTNRYNVKITSDMLDALDEKETQAIVFIGNALNEIMLFVRLLEKQALVPVETDLMNTIATHETMIILRTLIGKINEAWNMYRSLKPFLRQAHPDLANNLLLHEKEVSKVFDESPLSKIRNKLSFHFDFKQKIIEIDTKKFADAEVLDIFCVVDDTYSLVSFSEIYFTSAMLGAYKRNSDMENFRQLCSDVKTVSNKLRTMFFDIIMEILQGHHGQLLIETF